MNVIKPESLAMREIDKDAHCGRVVIVYTIYINSL